MSSPVQQTRNRHSVANGFWLSSSKPATHSDPLRLQANSIEPEVFQSEAEVGRAQLDEIHQAAAGKSGDLVIILLGGRGAQALHRLLGQMAETSDLDNLLGRLHVFTQDALAPLGMNNGLSFVRDFERLLGDAFFRKVKSFTPMRTDTDNLDDQLTRYAEKLESLGGIDLFFLGLGPEAGAASHLAYIKPGSGARSTDIAGVIPISPAILDHHIKKFKAGGSTVSEADEAECRAATHIMTLGPAAILSASRIVQSIVDADTAPAKRESYRRVLDAELSEDSVERAAQLDANPGLWLRLHPNVRSLVLPDVLAA
jgi:6-phosphogluconolactonase/glucosamine-6-phosphate isomerase/deaminase